MNHISATAAHKFSFFTIFVINPTLLLRTKENNNGKKGNHFLLAVGIVHAGFACVLSLMLPAVRDTVFIVS